ncbi:hypothetical protein BU14_3003s0001, partial [Porphyra umbilicalis]
VARADAAAAAPRPPRSGVATVSCGTRRAARTWRGQRLTHVAAVTTTGGGGGRALVCSRLRVGGRRRGAGRDGASSLRATGGGGQPAWLAGWQATVTTPSQPPTLPPPSFPLAPLRRARGAAPRPVAQHAPRTAAAGPYGTVGDALVLWSGGGCHNRSTTRPEHRGRPGAPCALRAARRAQRIGGGPPPPPAARLRGRHIPGRPTGRRPRRQAAGDSGPSLPGSGGATAASPGGHPRRAGLSGDTPRPASPVASGGGGGGSGNGSQTSGGAPPPINQPAGTTAGTTAVRVATAAAGGAMPTPLGGAPPGRGLKRKSATPPASPARRAPTASKAPCGGGGVGGGSGR